MIVKCFAYGPKGYTSAIAFFNEVSPVGLILSFINTEFFFSFTLSFGLHFFFDSLSLRRQRNALTVQIDETKLKFKLVLKKKFGGHIFTFYKT